MATYKIISDRCSLGQIGDSITDDDLAGINIDALIDGGFIATASAKVSKQDIKESDK
jgi:triosephosphate isomerase